MVIYGRKKMLFQTKSQRLAVNIMKTLGMNKSIISNLEQGKVLKTNTVKPITSFVEGLDNEDRGFIFLYPI